MLKYRLLALSVVLSLVGSATKAAALPAQIFTPYLTQIRTGMPPGWAMRLPSNILLQGLMDLQESDLKVKVFSTTSPVGLTVGVFTCETFHHPCLVSTFAVDSQASDNAQRELKKHQAAAAPIKLNLNEGVRGYLLEGPLQKQPYSFSSVMWQQNGMIYTVTAPATGRQNLLYLAYSMANESPMLSLAGMTPTPTSAIPPRLKRGTNGNQTPVNQI